MADSRRLHSFGEVDIDFDADDAEEAEGPVPFGRVDLDFGSEGFPPSSAPRDQTKITRRDEALPSLYDDDDITPVPGAVHEQATRVHDMSALSASTRPPPASTQQERREEPEPTPGSGIARLRSLYAQGDTDAALELASTIGGTRATMPPPSSASGDSPDSSIMVEYGEDDDDADIAALVGEAPVSSRPPPPSQAPRSALTLTQRQSIPRVIKAPHEIAQLPIDHRGGFLLAHVDGMQTLEEILDVCAMPHAEALEIIGSLESLGVIVFE